MGLKICIHKIKEVVSFRPSLNESIQGLQVTMYGCHNIKRRKKIKKSKKKWKQMALNCYMLLNRYYDVVLLKDNS